VTLTVEVEFKPLARGSYLEGLHVEGDDIWYTDVGGGGVQRVGSASSVRFVGADMRDLYVNVVDSAAAQRPADGTPRTEKTSILYRTRTRCAGRARHLHSLRTSTK
jgi:hypothetical protein